MPSSELRAPALAVSGNGVAMPGVIEAEVISGSHYGADRFRVRAALSASDPALLAAPAILLVVSAAIDGAWQELVRGNVDRVSIDPVQRIVELEGRDLTSLLIAARTQEAFANRTSSEIASLLAARHGLAASVMPTTTPVGRYYQSEHDRVTLDQFSRATTEWDLLVFLAQREGFEVWVSGATLYFAPASSSVAASLLLQPGDCIDLHLERALSLAGDIEVTVKSWNSQQRAAFVQRAKGGGGGAGAAGGPTQSYVFVRPNLTPDAALRMAQGILAELSTHERVFIATMPGELSLTPRGTVALFGTGTDFDQSYAVAEIERRIGPEGFVQVVRGRNSPNLTQTTAPTALFTPAA